MAKITRKTAQLFAITGASTDVEQFASFEVNGMPTYTTSPAVIMASPAWKLGWSATQLDGIFAPYFQDRNAVDLVALYQIAYLLQQGIAEWDTATPYFLDSVVQNGGGIYQSLQDNNVGNAPPAGASNSLWLLLAFPTTNQAKSPTRTVCTSGSGSYTPPSGCIRIFVRAVGAGGGGGSTNNTVNVGSAGTSTIFGSMIASGGAGGASATQNTVGVGGAGGAASGGDVNISGGIGGNGVTNGATTRNGQGGSSRFGGGPQYINLTSNNSDYRYPGVSAASNSGGGGSGAYFNSSTVSSPDYTGPAGGGAGGYVEKTFYSPGVISYVVGAGGAGASSAFGILNVGGNGGSGIIIIDEFYY